MFKRKKLHTSVMTSIGKVGIFKLTPTKNVRIWEELLENTAAPIPADFLKLVLSNLCELMMDSGKSVKLTDQTISELTDSDSNKIANTIISDWIATNEPDNKILNSLGKDFANDSIGLLYFIGHHALLQAKNRISIGKIADFSKKSYDYYAKSMNLYKHIESSRHPNSSLSESSENVSSEGLASADSSAPYMNGSANKSTEHLPFEGNMSTVLGPMKAVTKRFELFCEYSLSAHQALMELNQETKKTSEETRKYSKINFSISLAVLMLSVLSILLTLFTSYRSSESETRNIDRLIEALQPLDVSE